MSLIVKPDREPDFKLERWHFYWEEMVQYNSEMNKTFKIRVGADGDVQYWEDHEWSDYAGSRATVIARAYGDYVAERILLGN